MLIKFYRLVWYLASHLISIVLAVMAMYLFRMCLLITKLTIAVVVFIIDLILIIPVTVLIMLTDLLSIFSRRSIMDVEEKALADDPGISVIILNWNGGQFLEKVISPLLKEISMKDEIIVVDNNSSDRSVHIIKERFPQIKLLQLEKNYFFAKGNAFGLELVEKPITVFLNNDMIVQPGFLKQIRKSLINNEKIFSVSSEIFLWNPQQLRVETGRTRGIFQFGEPQLQHIPNGGKDVDVTFWSGGGSSAYSTAKLKMLGGFSELYSPFYWEDVDLSYRAWKRGWISLVDPAASVLHKHQGSSEGVITQTYIQRIKRRNMHLFVWANFSSWKMLVFYFINLPFRFVRSLVSADFDDLVAFLLAVTKLFSALKQRYAQKAVSVVSDEIVFKIANHYYNLREYQAAGLIR